MEVVVDSKPLKLKTLMTKQCQIFRLDQVTSQTGGDSSRFPYEYEGKNFVPAGGRGWKTNKLGLDSLKKANRLMAPASSTLLCSLFCGFSGLTNLQPSGAILVLAVLRNGKDICCCRRHPKVIEHCLFMTTDPGDLVLDPTCGSGTTAYVAEEWGRRWITIDTSRVAMALARTRLMSAKFPYYLLADSAEGREKRCGSHRSYPVRL